MKKTFARIMTVLMVLAMLVCCMSGLAVSAAEGEYTLFIAYGGDKAAENDWGWQYYGTDAEGITAVTATIKEGETATVSLTFDGGNINSWFFAPCLVADDVTGIVGIDFDVTCKIDGQEVAIDMAADAEGKTWWTEGTGDYSATQCIRLAGGYNEWATKYIAEPAGFTTIEYTITLNSITMGDPNAPAGNTYESTDEYNLFIAYGGDKAAENDWGVQYYGAEVEGITAVNATAKSGDTVTISLTMDGGNINSWFFAPCLVGEDITTISAIDFDITCKIDGEEVAIDMAADADGKTWWTEGTGEYTGEQCIRLAGGYNEWATKYVAEPAGFTTIEYTITLNSIQITEVVEEEPVVVEIDKDGTYNAYLMLQTPGWTFRNAWDDSYYGIEGTGWADINNAWGDYLVHTDADKQGLTWGKVTDTVIAGNGTYSVSITDFGTVFADDFTNNGQEYFNILAISTDLPAGADVTITNVELVIDGQVRHTYPEAYINSESTTSLQILVQNIWNADVAELSYYPAPTESLEIRFTISGFNYDNADQAEPEAPVEEPETPAEPEVPEEPVEEPKNNTWIWIVVAAAVVIVVIVVVAVVRKKKA